MENLPTLPVIAMKILEAVMNEKTSVKEIGYILSKDPPLTGKVLKLINSSFYGLPTKITSVSHAVNLLGINAVKNLALGFSLIRSFGKENENDFDYSFFWKSSLIGAVSAKSIAQKIFPLFAEDAFTLGLLQNIGILALKQCMPKQCELVLKERERTLCFYYEAEDQILGFNHMEIGEYLVKKWGLPETFYKPISCHHCPERLKNDNPEISMPAKILIYPPCLLIFLSSQEKNISLG